jgi:hypothetical protein
MTCCMSEQWARLVLRWHVHVHVVLCEISLHSFAGCSALAPHQ